MAPSGRCVGRFAKKKKKRNRRKEEQCDSAQIEEGPISGEAECDLQLLDGSPDLLNAGCLSSLTQHVKTARLVPFISTRSRLTPSVLPAVTLVFSDLPSKRFGKKKKKCLVDVQYPLSKPSELRQPLGPPLVPCQALYRLTPRPPPRQN